MNQEIYDLINKFEKESDNIITLIQMIKECGKEKLEEMKTINSDNFDNIKNSFNTYFEYINNFYSNKQVKNLIENLNVKINSFSDNSLIVDPFSNPELKSDNFYSQYNNIIDDSSFMKEESSSPTKKIKNDIL